MRSDSDKRSSWICCDIDSAIRHDLLSKYPTIDGRFVKVLQVIELSKDSKRDLIVEYEFINKKSERDILISTLYNRYSKRGIGKSNLLHFKRGLEIMHDVLNINIDEDNVHKI